MTVTSPVRALRRGVIARWAWFVPLLVAAFIYETRGTYLERAAAALLALFVVLAASRRPDRSLLILIVLLPFQGLLLAQLYAWGAPGQLVRPMTAWKEALALGVVIAGVRGFRASGRRLDRLDGLGISYVAIVAAYASVPTLFAPGAPVDTSVRSLGFRSSAGFVILLLAARHARLPEDFPSRAARVVMIVGGVVAAVAVYEYLFPAGWNRFIVDRVQYPRYEIDIVHGTPFSLTDIRRYGYIGGQRFLRTGSVFLDPTPCGFFLVLPFAVAVERRLRAGLRNGGGALLLLIGVALLLTQTRAALIAALVVAFLAVRPAAGRTQNRRLQFALLFAAGVVILLPAATASGLSQRVTTTASSQDQSSTDHVRSFWNGVHAVGAEPLGHGLGTSAGVGQRFAEGSATVPENSFLQVGIETGVLGMAAFIALTLVALRRLTYGARTFPDVGISVARTAGVGLAIGACLLPAWNEFAVAWSFWALAGAAIGLAEREAAVRARSAPFVKREIGASS